MFRALGRKWVVLMKLKLFGWLFAASFVYLTAQVTGGERPRFAVASVKPSNLPGRAEIGNFNGRGYGKNATLKMLMATAYQVQTFQILGGPAWAGSDRFDVEARAEDPNTGYIQLRLMMQSLFEDRFRLKIHRETKISTIYLLVVAKGGPKIKLSADQESPDAGPSTSPHDGPPRGSVLMGRGLLVANAIPLPVLAKTLTPEMERPIVDKTNLKGRFDIHLEWTPSPLTTGDGGAPATSNGADLPTVFSALREQLGLQLKSGRGPVEFLMIDSVEKPSPN